MYNHHTAIGLILLVIQFFREIRFDEIDKFVFEFQSEVHRHDSILFLDNDQYHREQ